MKAEIIVKFDLPNDIIKYNCFAQSTDLMEAAICFREWLDTVKNSPEFQHKLVKIDDVIEAFEMKYKKVSFDLTELKI